MLSRWIRTWIGKSLRPFVIFIARYGITPNILTVGGLIIIVISGFILAHGYMALAGCLLILGGLLDGLDGELARVLHSETKFGAFLDSISDHCGDFAVCLGLLWLSLNKNLMTDVILLFIALFGSVFGSQVRSRAGMLGIDTKDIGLFTRFERGLVLLIGLFTGKITSALWVLAVINNLSALQRIVYVARTRPS